MEPSLNWRTIFTTRWRVKMTLPADMTSYLWSTRCSKAKSNKAEGTPKELYQSPLNLYFYRMMEAKGTPYAIVSDKYGLHMDREVLPTYDVHPSLLTVDDKMKLGALVRARIEAYGYTGIIFYNNSPLRSIPYIDILSFASVPMVFTTRISSNVVRSLR